MFLDQGRLDISPGEKDYNIVFGEGILDLSDTSMDELADKIDVNVVLDLQKLYCPGMLLSASRPILHLHLYSFRMTPI